MKSANRPELEKLVSDFQILRGARLQKVFALENLLGMGFWKRGNYWLWLDMTPVAPMMILTEEKIFKGAGVVKPLSLFIKSHLVGGELTAIDQRGKVDKIVDMVFQLASGVGTIETRLFAHGQNIFVTAEDKKMSWHRLKELKASSVASEAAAGLKGTKTYRSPLELQDQWFMGWQDKSQALLLPKFQSRPKSSKGEDAKNQGKPAENVKAKAFASWEKIKLKKEKAMAKITADMVKKNQVNWRGLGDWIKLHQSLEVPKVWQEHIDTKRGFSWNLQNCYQKAKSLAEKKQRTLLRLAELEADLKVHLQITAFDEWSQTLTAPTQKEKKVDFGARTRKMSLGTSGDAYVGKSAADNLKLLRKARAWDLWLHVKDLPSAHCVIRKNKAVKISQNQLAAVGAWLLAEGLKSRANSAKGQKFEILTTECRYVRPIKGDKVGRVNYTHESIFMVQLP